MNDIRINIGIKDKEKTGEKNGLIAFDNCLLYMFVNCKYKFLLYVCRCPVMHRCGVACL